MAAISTLYFVEHHKQNEHFLSQYELNQLASNGLINFNRLDHRGGNNWLQQQMSKNHYSGAGGGGSNIEYPFLAAAPSQPSSQSTINNRKQAVVTSATASSLLINSGSDANRPAIQYTEDVAKTANNAKQKNTKNSNAKITSTVIEAAAAAINRNGVDGGGSRIPIEDESQIDMNHNNSSNGGSTSNNDITGDLNWPQLQQHRSQPDNTYLLTEVDSNLIDTGQTKRNESMYANWFSIFFFDVTFDVM